MGRLKGIPHILSPDILHLLAVTGHGDEIVLADINFPTHTICSGEGAPHEYRADGLKIPELLDAILTLMPLDTYVETPVLLMDPAMKDKGLPVPVWKDYTDICKKKQGCTIEFKWLERFEFYEHARTTYAIIHTGETAAYANIILKRGVC